jgi:hypothetical protein
MNREESIAYLTTALFSACVWAALAAVLWAAL